MYITQLYWNMKHINTFSLHFHKAVWYKTHSNRNSPFREHLHMYTLNTCVRPPYCVYIYCLPCIDIVSVGAFWVLSLHCMEWCLFIYNYYDVYSLVYARNQGWRNMCTMIDQQDSGTLTNRPSSYAIFAITEVTSLQSAILTGTCERNS